MREEIRNYELTDGTTITVEEIMELVEGIKRRNVICRLGRTRDRDKLLKPVRVTNSEPRPKKKFLLTNGEEYTVEELMKITGCKYPTMISRLHSSEVRDAERIMKTAPLNLKEQDKRKGTQLAMSRMLGDPDGFWKLFNKHV